MTATDHLFQDHVAAELRKGDQRMDDIVAKINAIEVEQAAAKIALLKNTETTDKVEANTSEMLEVFQSWKGAMRALEMIGKLAKPLGYIASLCAGVVGIWAAIKAR